MLLRHWARATASRTFCTAGRSNPTRIASSPGFSATNPDGPVGSPERAGAGDSLFPADDAAARRA